MTEHVSVKAIRRATRRGPRAIRDVPGDAVAQGWASTAVCFRRAVRGVNPRGAQTDRDAPGADTHERVMRGPGVVWPGSEPQLRLMHRRGTWCALRVVSVRILTGPARIGRCGWGSQPPLLTRRRPAWSGAALGVPSASHIIPNSRQPTDRQGGGFPVSMERLPRLHCTARGVHVPSPPA